MGRIYWTKERIIEVAKNYDSLSKFNVNHRQAYNYAKKDGYLYELFKKRKKKPTKPISKTMWTLESLKEFVKDCRFRSDLLKKNSAAYSYASKHKLIDILFEDKPNKGYKRAGDYKYASGLKNGSKLYWTKERIIEEGRKYDTRLEFKKSCITAYMRAMCEGYLDEIFKDKPNLGYQKAITAKGKKRNSTTGHRKYWTEEKVLETISKWQGPLRALCRKHSGLNATIERLKLRPKVKEIRNRIFESIPREQIEADAKKYSSRYEFRKHSFHTYRAAQQRQLLDELFPRYIPKNAQAKE